MRKELEALRLHNAALEKRESPQDPLTGKNATLQDLRAKSSLTSKVDHFFAHLEDSRSKESKGSKKKLRKSLERATQEVGDTPLN